MALLLRSFALPRQSGDLLHFHDLLLKAELAALAEPMLPGIFEHM
jgi:hypothetical protein